MKVKISPGPKQIRYQLYMQANGLKTGDYHEGHAYQMWLSKHLQEFKRMKNMQEYQSLESHGQQENFTDYLRRGGRYE